MDTCLIVDGLNFIYKGKVKFTSQNQMGPDFTLVYNFFRNLRSLVGSFNPAKVFFCQEGRNNFRKELSADYKANRTHLIKQGSLAYLPDDSFYRQVDIIYNLLQYMPITVVTADGVEGDDIIYSLVDNLRSEQCIISSNDNDLIQLLQRGYPYVHLYNPFKKEWVTAPDYLHVIYKCLAGDKSDNIKRLVSKKRAIEMASDPEKLRAFLESEENRANFNINRQLIELRLVPDTQLFFADYRANFEVLRLHFQEMQFNSLLSSEYWSNFKSSFSHLKI